MRERSSVRVLLISSRQRLLLLKYRNRSPSGALQPCWTTAGGGREADETIEQAAAREILEETGIEGVRFGPIVWYGEDGMRCRDWGMLFKEHFIVAFAPTETLDTRGWTDHERNEIIETRWWTASDIQLSSEPIYPFGLAKLLEPLLAGVYPPELVILPRI